jgi:S1-C subfamily serine protease
VLVLNVARASQAARYGLREGDVIESVNGQLFSLTAQMSQLFADNASLTLGLVRHGQKLTINLPAVETKAK